MVYGWRLSFDHQMEDYRLKIAELSVATDDTLPTTSTITELELVGRVVVLFRSDGVTLHKVSKLTKKTIFLQNKNGNESRVLKALSPGSLYLVLAATPLRHIESVSKLEPYCYYATEQDSEIIEAFGLRPYGERLSDAQYASYFHNLVQHNFLQGSIKWADRVAWRIPIEYIQESWWGDLLTLGKYCSHCGRLLDYEVDTMSCDMCDSFVFQIKRCSVCGVIVLDNDKHLIFDDATDAWKIVCANHFAGKVVCPICGEGYERKAGDSLDLVCPQCRASMQECDVCGELKYQHNLSIRRGIKICSNCACSKLPSYHSNKSRSDPKYQGELSLSTTGFIGIELEVDMPRTLRNRRNDYLTPEVTALMLKKRFAVLDLDTTRDSSLDYGFEIQSQPTTYERWQENRYLWDQVSRFLLYHGYRGHDARTAGLHFHVSRTYFNKPDKAFELLGYVLSKYTNEWRHFSRREDMDWAQPIDDECGSWSQTQLEEAVADRYFRVNATHHSIVNDEHSKTFEFRMFRSTLNIQTLYASLALVHNLCLMVNEVCAASDAIEQVMQWTPESIIRQINNPDLMAYAERIKMLSCSYDDGVESEIEPSSLLMGDEVCA